MAENHKELEYVRSHLPYRALLEGLAEECCELAQAALKMVRAVNGENPTYASPDEYREKIAEEAGDVLMVMEVLGIIPGGTTASNPKWGRWVFRIKERSNSKGGC